VAQDRPKTSQGFVLEAGEHRLQDILNSAAEFLNRNYIMPTAELANAANTIEIQRKLNLDAIGCEEVVSQLAYVKGFTIVPLDPLRGLYEVVSQRGQRVAEIGINPLHLSPDEVLRKSRMKVQVLTSVPLKHLDAAKASQQLRPFFTSGGGRNGLQFGNAGNQRSLLLQGYASQVAGAIRLLREVDKPEREAFPKTYYTQLRALVASTNQQANSLQAVKQRLADLEAQFAALAPSKTKK